MNRKLILTAIILGLSAIGLTSCGNPNPVVEETSQGVYLKDKARQATGQQAEDSDKTDDMLDSIPGSSEE